MSQRPDRKKRTTPTTAMAALEFFDLREVQDFHTEVMTAPLAHAGMGLGREDAETEILAQTFDVYSRLHALACLPQKVLEELVLTLLHFKILCLRGIL
jgi:hypothetical protein